MDRNVITIEVKPIDRDKPNIEADIDKLNSFIKEAKYCCAILLVYGQNENNKLENIGVNA